jgi:hypothetical protein
MSRFINALLLLAAAVTSAAAQDKPPPATAPEGPQGTITYRQIEELPLKRLSHRPKLSLQKALKIAEEFIEREKIDIAPYYLYEAKFTMYGSPGRQEACWYFWWVKETGALGDYVQLVVNTKTGAVRLLPSM